MAFPTTSEVNRYRSLSASQVRTATWNTGDLTNGGHRGLQLTVDITVGVSVAITPKVEGKDPISGKYYQLHANFTQLTGTGTTVYEIYPSAGAAAGGITAIGAHNLPRIFKVTFTHGDATTSTYSAAINLLV